MITPEIISFIKDQDAKGTSREATRGMLAGPGGWSQGNIDEAFAAVPLVFAAPDAKTPNPPAPPPVPAAIAAPAKKNPLALLATLGALVLLVGVGGGAAYAISPGVRHEVQYLVASPEQKVALSLLKLSEAPRYQITVGTETYNEEGEDKLEGYLANLVKQRSALEVTGTVERIEGDSTGLPMRVRSTFKGTTLGTGETVTIRGETYADPSTLLVRLTDTVDFLFFTTEPLTGKWISLLEGTEDTGMDVPFNPELMGSIVTGYSVYRDTLAYLMQHAPEYLRATDTNDVRTIMGERARRFEISVDPGELTRVMLASPLTTSDRLTLESRDRFTKEIPALAEQFDAEKPVELWISEKTHYPVKWRSVLREEVELLDIAYTRVSESTGTVTVPGDAVIEVPQKDLTMSEAFTIMMSGMNAAF